MLRPFLFCVIGSAAACAHFSSAVFCVAFLQWTPTFANLAGFAIGLATSYGGQSRITFRRTRGEREPLARFLASALSGFLVNATVFAALLRWTRLDYRIALVIALLVAAALTFFIMDRWVFAATPVVAHE